MLSKLAAASLLASVTLPFSVAQAATKTTVPKAGGACRSSQLGQVVVVGGKRLACSQRGKKTVWLAALPPLPPATPSAAPTPTAPTVLFRDDFSNINGGWTVVRAAGVGEAGYREESFLVVALRPSDPGPPVGVTTVQAPTPVPMYFGVRVPNVSGQANVAIDVQAKLLSQQGAFSVGCYDNGPPDASTRYEGLIGYDDKWVINELRQGKVTTLAAGDLQLNVLRRGVAAHQFRLVCSGAPGGSGRIAIQMNGQTIAEKTVTGMLPAGGASIWSVAYPGVTGSQVIFDSMAISRS